MNFSRYSEHPRRDRDTRQKLSLSAEDGGKVRETFDWGHQREIDRDDTSGSEIRVYRWCIMLFRATDRHCSSSTGRNNQEIIVKNKCIIVFCCVAAM